MIPRAAIDISGALAHIAGRYDVLVAAVDGALARGAQEVARTARRNAPKAFSTLTNAIRVDRVGEMHYRVVAGVSHSRFVEYGRKPGRQPGTGNGLAEWVRFKTRLNGADLERRTFLVARGIAKRGIKPQPFMIPALEENENRIRALVKGAIAQINREPGRG